MRFADLLKMKTVEALVVVLSAKVRFKVTILPTTKLVGEDWIDGDPCLELVGRWKGRKIKTDYIFNQKDLDALKDNILFNP